MDPWMQFDPSPHNLLAISEYCLERGLSNFSPPISLVVAHHWALSFTVGDLLHPWCGVHGVITMGSGYLLLLDVYVNVYNVQTTTMYYLPEKIPQFRDVNSVPRKLSGA